MTNVQPTSGGQPMSTQPPPGPTSMQSPQGGMMPQAGTMPQAGMMPQGGMMQGGHLYIQTNEIQNCVKFVDQLCQDTGGPCTYTGRNMKETHTNMGVTTGEFNAFVEDLVATLDDFNVPKADQDELLRLLAPMESEIVEVDSPQVATPLPAAFSPGPPL